MYGVYCTTFPILFVQPAYNITPHIQLILSCIITTHIPYVLLVPSYTLEPTNYFHVITYFSSLFLAFEMRFLCLHGEWLSVRTCQAISWLHVLGFGSPSFRSPAPKPGPKSNDTFPPSNPNDMSRPLATGPSSVFLEHVQVRLVFR
jgi:hypothetical protein